MSKIFNPLGRTMQRRDFLKVAGASVAVAALPASVRAADPVKIVLWSWVPDLQLQVDMFNAAHPGIQIELVNAGQGDPQYQAVRAGLQAGSGLPDAGTDGVPAMALRPPAAAEARRRVRR
jgi:multiple sugar transport system substrate-binding protein